MDEYDQYKIRWVVLEQQATVCEREGQGMCGEISRCRKCRPEFLREHSQPKSEINGIKLRELVNSDTRREMRHK